MIENVPEDLDEEELGIIEIKAGFNGKDFQLGRLLFEPDTELPDVMRGLAEYLRYLASNLDFSSDAHSEIEKLLTGEFE